MSKAYLAYELEKKWKQFILKFHNKSVFIKVLK